MHGTIVPSLAIRLERAERRYVENGRVRDPRYKKCRASFNQLLSHFRSDLLFDEIAERLDISDGMVAVYYRNYCQEFCDNESAVARARRILALRRQELKDSILSGPWPPLVRRVAELVKAGGCDAEPEFVKERNGYWLSPSLIRLNGRLAYIHHTQQLHKPTSRSSAVSIPLRVDVEKMPSVEYRAVYAEPPGYGTRLFIIPSDILEGRKSWYIPVGPRKRSGPMPRIDLSVFLNAYPPRKRSTQVQVGRR